MIQICSKLMVKYNTDYNTKYNTNYNTIFKIIYVNLHCKKHNGYLSYLCYLSYCYTLLTRDTCNDRKRNYCHIV